MCQLLREFPRIVPIRQTRPARLQFDAEKRMCEKLRHRRLPSARPLQITRRRRKRGGEPFLSHLRPRCAEILIERCRAEDVQITVGRTLFLTIDSTILRQRLPLPREAHEIARRHREIRLRQEAQPLQFPMARDKHHKEQQKKTAEHRLCRRPHIIAVDQRSEHRGKDHRTREDVPRPLRILRPLQRDRILAHIFIEQFLQSEAPSHFAIIHIIAQLDSRM